MHGFDKMISLNDILKEKNPDLVLRTKHKSDMEKCCTNVDPQDHCIYNPCCFCLTRDLNRNGENLEESEMDFQCRIVFGVNRYMDYEESL